MVKFSKKDFIERYNMEGLYRHELYLKHEKITTFKSKSIHFKSQMIKVFAIRNGRNKSFVVRIGEVYSDGSFRCWDRYTKDYIQEWRAKKYYDKFR